MKNVVSVRTNTVFSLDYQSGKLQPQIELIILSPKPLYKVKGDKARKVETELEETRLLMTPEIIRRLTGELMRANSDVNQIESMGEALNSVIDAYREQKEVKP